MIAAADVYIRQGWFQKQRCVAVFGNEIEFGDMLAARGVSTAEAACGAGSSGHVAPQLWQRPSRRAISFKTSPQCGQAKVSMRVYSTLFQHVASSTLGLAMRIGTAVHLIEALSFEQSARALGYCS